MKAIINTWAKDPKSIYNGRTFDVVSHYHGFFKVEIEGEIYTFDSGEILIVDIDNEIRHAAIRDEKTFCDYWFKMISKYVKENTIKLKIKETAQKETKIDSTFEQAPDDEFETVPDEFIFNHKNENDELNIY